MIIRKSNLEKDRIMRLERRTRAIRAGRRIDVTRATAVELINFAREVGIDVDAYKDPGHRLDRAFEMLSGSVFDLTHSHG